MMIKVWQRSTWTGWCQHDLYACSRMTSRMASTCDWRSWAAEMVITLFKYTVMTLVHFLILTCSHLHLGYQRLTTPTPLSSVSTGGSCKEKEFRCENGRCVPADAQSVVCDSVNDCGDGSDEKYCGKIPNLTHMIKDPSLLGDFLLKTWKILAVTKILTWNTPSKLMQSVKQDIVLWASLPNIITHFAHEHFTTCNETLISPFSSVSYNL